MPRLACVVCLCALAAAGCGGATSHPPTRAKLPRALARTWAGEAERIAAVTAAGDSCRARRLAASLRTEVIKAGGKVPLQLRTSLLDGVNSLANRIACTPAPVTVTQPPPGPASPPSGKHPPHGHGHHGGHGHDKHGGDQGDGG